jgi:hypothetical protein
VARFDFYESPKKETGKNKFCREKKRTKGSEIETRKGE